MAAPRVFAYPCDEASGDILAATGGGLIDLDLAASGTPTTSGGQRRLEGSDYFTGDHTQLGLSGLVCGLIRSTIDSNAAIQALIQAGSGTGFDLYFATAGGNADGVLWNADYLFSEDVDAAVSQTVFFLAIVGQNTSVTKNGATEAGTSFAATGTLPYFIVGIEGTALSAYGVVGTIGPIGLITSPGDGTHDVQAILIDGVPDGGSINVNGSETLAASASDFASAAALQTFLGGMDGWAGKVTVTGGSGVFAISFDATLGEVAAITLDTNTLEQSSRALYIHAAKLRTGEPYTPPDATSRSSPFRSNIFRSNRLRASVA